MSECEKCKMLEMQIEFYQAERKRWKRRVEKLKKHISFFPDNLDDTPVKVKISPYKYANFTIGYWVERLNNLIDGDFDMRIDEKNEKCHRGRV